jgi:hypothetical protein
MYPALGIFGGLGGPELIVIFLVAMVLLILPGILYLVTLQRALDRCAVESRTLSPGLVWLMLIPLFSLVWHFIVVNGISKSLHNEFARRNTPNVEPEPGKGIGLATCILSATSIIPVIGLFSGLAGLVCWIIYWVRIAGYSNLLQQTMGASVGGWPPPNQGTTAYYR